MDTILNEDPVNRRQELQGKGGSRSTGRKRKVQSTAAPVSRDTRVCVHCGFVLDLDQFAGLSDSCFRCEANALRRKKVEKPSDNGEIEPKPTRHPGIKTPESVENLLSGYRVCPGCGEKKSVLEFRIDRSTRSGVHGLSRNCNKCDGIEWDEEIAVSPLTLAFLSALELGDPPNSAVMSLIDSMVRWMILVHRQLTDNVEGQRWFESGSRQVHAVMREINYCRRQITDLLPGDDISGKLDDAGYPVNSEVEAK